MKERAVGLVAGSGIDLRPVLDEITEEIPFEKMEGLKAVTVGGHESVFLAGRCGKQRVILQCGRFHAYEGGAYDAVVRTVDVLRDAGAATVLFTNAAGGLRDHLSPGHIVAAEMVHTWAFRHWNLPRRIQPEIVLAGCDAAGPYYWMHGPCYETPAEIEALRRLDAAAVGMSSAPEMQRCRELGIASGLVSCITNVCGSQEKLTHEHVLEAAKEASGRLSLLIRDWIANGGPQDG